MYNRPESETFCKKLGSLHSKATLTITGAIQDTSRDTIYHKLVLESHKSKRWYRHFSCMFKIMKEEAPD